MCTIVQYFEYALALPFFGTGMKTLYIYNSDLYIIIILLVIIGRESKQSKTFNINVFYQRTNAILMNLTIYL